MCNNIPASCSLGTITEEKDTERKGSHTLFIRDGETIAGECEGDGGTQRVLNDLPRTRLFLVPSPPPVLSDVSKLALLLNLHVCRWSRLPM
jgi:hypothetical protein